MEKAFHLYLTNACTQESHSLLICTSINLEDIRNSIVNLIKSMNIGSIYSWYWYSDDFAYQKALEITSQLSELLDEGSKLTKKKFPFHYLGFIITNYGMWPDGKGGYEKDGI